MHPFRPTLLSAIFSQIGQIELGCTIGSTTGMRRRGHLLTSSYRAGAGAKAADYWEDISQGP